MKSKTEAAEKLLKEMSARKQNDLNSHLVERTIKSANMHSDYKDYADIDLQTLMEVAGISLSTPIASFINRDIPINTYLLAADFANVIKQRFTAPTLTQLRQTTRLEGGILPRVVGTVHRPALMDLCGGRSVTIAPSAMNHDGAIGTWKPFTSESLESFRTGEYSEIGTVSAEFIQTERGAMYKYAFGLKVDRKMTRQSISVDYVGKFLEGVFLHVEGEMWDHLYDKVRKSVEPIPAQSLGAEADTFTERYAMNKAVWGGLKEQYDKNHAMTDVFTDPVQHEVARGLKLRDGAVIVIDGNSNFFEIRNRLADGTYVWSKPFTKPEPFTYVTLDRQSAATFFYQEGSEISERRVEILEDSFTTTFSIIVGFEVTDTNAVKVVTLGELG